LSTTLRTCQCVVVVLIGLVVVHVSQPAGVLRAAHVGRQRVGHKVSLIGHVGAATQELLVCGSRR
jgi:hypothetical protein